MDTNISNLESVSDVELGDWDDSSKDELQASDESMPSMLDKL